MELKELEEEIFKIKENSIVILLWYNSYHRKINNLI